jgi:hypothetical protein
VVKPNYSLLDLSFLGRHFRLSLLIPPAAGFIQAAPSGALEASTTYKKANEYCNSYQSTEFRHKQLIPSTKPVRPLKTL